MLGSDNADSFIVQQDSYLRALNQAIEDIDHAECYHGT
jgi:hypothetical protein